METARSNYRNFPYESRHLKLSGMTTAELAKKVNILEYKTNLIKIDFIHHLKPALNAGMF